MRDEMDDMELSQLEQRLRNSVVGHRPAAPGRLCDYIDNVPVANPRAGRIGLAFERPRLRRGTFAVAAAAAVVVAVVGSAALVSLRQPSGPVAASATVPGIVSDGWAWQATDGTLFIGEVAVPNGFIATCGRSSEQEIVDQTLCSSPDGLHWSIPADPAIVSVDGTDPFLPLDILVRNGIYLATSSPGSGEFQGPGRTLWRSIDGVHWAEVDTSASLGGMVGFSLMVAVPDGFLAVGRTNRAGSPLEFGVFVSSDGSAWSRASDLPFETGTAGSGYYLGPTLAAGLYAGGTRPDGVATGTWRTTDGRTWDVVTLPAGYSQLNTVVALPDGSLRAVASSFDVSRPNVLVDSTDGLSWQIDPTAPTGSVDLFGVVGDRMVAYVSATPYTDPHEVLQSDDWGQSWRPLLDPSGKPVTGRIGILGGRLEIRGGADFATQWLLTPVPRDPAASPVESPMVAASESPATSESAAPTSEPPPTPESSATPAESAAPTPEPPPTPEPSATPVESAAQTPEPSATTP